MDHLLNYNLEELKEVCLSLGDKKFRAEQVLSCLLKNKKLEEGNLPKDFCEKLKQNYLVNSVSIYKTFLDKEDGTEKFLFKMHDNELVEGVLMKYKYGNTFCISCQVGCRMGCVFCASSKLGLKRNLSTGEMLEMFILVNGDNRNITNLVLMGMGEPLDNYENVIRFLKLITSPKHLNISARNISLSTCGVVPKIIQLAKENLAITLSLSLHATTDEYRSSVMPVNNAYKLGDVIGALREYYSSTKRRVAIEYTLIKGVNDSNEDIGRLNKLLEGIDAFVNVIVLNNTGNKTLLKTSRDEAYQFVQKLKRAGLNANLRRTLGQNIEGACGMLRLRTIEDENK